MVNFRDFCLWEDRLMIDYDEKEENMCKDIGRDIRDNILMNQQLKMNVGDLERWLKKRIGTGGGSCDFARKEILEELQKAMKTE